MPGDGSMPEGEVQLPPLLCSMDFKRELSSHLSAVALAEHVNLRTARQCEHCLSSRLSPPELKA